MKSDQRHRWATSEDIQEILGSAAEGDLVNAILHTNASRKEVLEAFEWLHDDDYMGAGLERPMDARSQQVYDILHRELNRDGREERRDAGGEES